MIYQKSNAEKFLNEKDKSSLSLQQSEKRYSKLIENINEGLIFLDDKDQIRFANRCARNIFQISNEKLVNHSIFNFVLSSSDHRKLKMPKELKKSGCSHKEEMQLVKGNGEIFWAALNIGFLDKLHGFEPGSIITIKDITDQKQAEEKLHALTVNLNQRVKQLDCLFEVSELTHFPDASLEHVLQESIKVIPFGLKHSGNIWVEINTDDGNYRSKNFKETNLFYKAPIKGQKQNYGYLRVGYSGVEENNYKKFFHVNEKILIRNVAEKIARMIDIRNMEQSLKEGINRLKELHKLVRIGSYEVDLNTGLIRFGYNFFDIMGADPEKRATYTFDDFIEQVHDDDRSRMKDYADRIMSGDTSVMTFVYRVKTHSGQIRHIFANAKVLYDDQDRPTTIMGAIQDITKEFLILKKQKIRQ